MHCDCILVGSRPDELEAIRIFLSNNESIFFNKEVFNFSFSGAFSCTKDVLFKASFRFEKRLRFLIEALLFKPIFFKLVRAFFTSTFNFFNDFGLGSYA